MTLKFNGPTINIEDPALEKHREKITKLLEKSKDMMAENFYELEKTKDTPYNPYNRKNRCDKQKYYRNL